LCEQNAHKHDSAPDQLSQRQLFTQECPSCQRPEYSFHRKDHRRMGWGRILLCDDLNQEGSANGKDTAV
jgi:hypothetical protein